MELINKHRIITKYEMNKTIEYKDICAAFFYGYKFCTITEQLIAGKIQSPDLDKLKKTAVECMKDYI